MTGFDELGLGRRLCAAVSDMGWTEPTPIQAAAVPAGLAGRDVLGQAQTGTGKTGAYALTVLGRVKPRSGRPAALVLVPTRELSDQVCGEFRKLSARTGHVVCVLHGGSGLTSQTRFLERGCDVVVGTPGRVLDMHRRGTLVLDSVRELVIDEADRMLDMGFSDEMGRIVGSLPECRQTLMFSATLSDEVRGLASGWMREPEEVSVSKGEPATELVRQCYALCERRAKRWVLQDILDNGDPKTLVFCSTKVMAENLCSLLSNEGRKVGELHGDLPQARREKTIRAFRDSRVRVLVATDVAARGIDVEDIDVVVNYDAPNDPEVYVHRIGRAGRAGRRGTAVTFVTPIEDRRIPSYRDYTGMDVEEVAREDIRRMRLSDRTPQKSGEEDDEGSGTVRGGLPADKVARESMAVIALDIGKDDGVSRADVLGIVMRAGIHERETGRVGMSKTSSFVEVLESALRIVTGGDCAVRFKGRTVRLRQAPAKTKCRDKLAERDASRRRCRSRRCVSAPILFMRGAFRLSHAIKSRPIRRGRGSRVEENEGIIQRWKRG